MKVSCNHCGTKNELGRIFCMSCGKKMTITNADVSQAVEDRRAFDVMTLVKPLLLVAVLGLFLLAAWPVKTDAPGIADADKAQVRAGLVAKINSLIAAARGGKEASALFNSREVGVYLEARRGTVATNQTPLYARLEGARMIVVQEFFAGPFRVGSKRVGPFRFTRELTCEAVGRTFKAKSGRFGHFPLPGPLTAVLIDPVGAAFILTPAEQAIEKKLSEMSIQDGELELVVAP